MSEATPEPYGPPTEAEEMTNRLEATLARRTWIAPEQRLLFAAVEFPKLSHTDYVCTTVHEDGGWTCQFCAGGLSACAVCNSFEGATTDHCPGDRMTADQLDAVYAGTLNYRDGAWRAECCRVMRPVYDRDAYMAEAGYQPDGQGGWTLMPQPQIGPDGFAKGGYTGMGPNPGIPGRIEPTYPDCATCDGGGCGDCV